MQKYHQSHISPNVAALPGNLKALKWVIKRGCPTMDERTFEATAGAGDAKVVT
jgi:hypothetical protein